MLNTHDVIAGKIVVQLGYADADTVRAQLRELREDGGRLGDLVNRLTHAGLLDQQQIERIRHRTALYEHVRHEATYVRLLEKRTQVPRQMVIKLLAGLERSAFRRRLGEVLVRNGNLREEYDRQLVESQRRLLEKDDRRILARYVNEDFAGVARPLIKGSQLDPAEFKISTLFRSKKTRALVDREEMEFLRAEAQRAAAQHQAAVASTVIMDPEPVAQTRAVADGDAAAPASPPRDDVAGIADPPPEPVLVPPPEPVLVPPPAEAPPAEAPPADPADALPSPTVVAKGEPAPEESSGLTVQDVEKLKRLADYTIVEVLGVGGMGAVFLGQKDGAGEYVAIKVMLNNLATAEDLARFQREIALTQRVDHPKVLKVIESGETEEGLSYVIAPALAGKELRDLLDLQEGKRLAPPLAVTVLVQILEGLQAVHEAGVVHRDLKPENLFVLAGGEHEVRLMDFGLAKPSDTEQGAQLDVFRSIRTQVSGSPAYIAPESITCDPIDARTDIYSLGTMFFEMLTGVLPLDSETSSGYLTQHLICPPLTLAEAAPDLAWPPEAEDLLARMMGKGPEERPDSCSAILAELGSGLANKIREVPPVAEETEEPVEPEPPSEPEEPAWGFKGFLGWLRGKK